MSNAPDKIWAHENKDGSRWFFKSECPTQSSLPTDKYLLATPERELAGEMVEALKVMVVDKMDYMDRNNLGDPEEKFDVKFALSVLRKLHPPVEGEE